MRTTVTLDESLVRELLKISKSSTKTGAVTKAVKEQIRRAKLEKLAGLLGSIDVDENAIEAAGKADKERDRLLATVGAVEEK